MITLGVDVGTTRIKVLALDVASGRTLALEAAETPVRRDTHGEAHRPAEVLETVIALLARGDPVAGASRRGGGPLLCQRRRGGRAAGRRPSPGRGRHRLVRPARHGRGGSLPGRSRRRASASPRTCRRTPRSRSSSSSGSGTTSQPTWRGRRAWTDLGDFVLLGLGGDLVMDWSHASRAGAFDLRARAWDRDTIAATGLDVAFPPLVASGTVIGTLAPDIAKRTGLPPGVLHRHWRARPPLRRLRGRPAHAIRPVPLGRHVGGAPGAAGGSRRRSGWPRPPLPPRPGLLRRP